MAADFVRPVAEEIGKGIVASVMREFNYLCCFKKNIESMRAEARRLEDERDGLKDRVDAASSRGEVIVPKVNTWLTTTDEIQLRIRKEIEDMIPNAENGGLNIKARYLLSKKAKAETEAMEKHRKEVSEFHTIANPAPPTARLPFSLGPRHELGSREGMEDEIVEGFRRTLALESRKQMDGDIELLSQPKVNIVGIAGMGGLGKTTMAHNIMKRLMEGKLVEDAVKVVVGRSANLLEIQGAIARQLGLEELEKELEVRSRHLLSRLTNTKRTVILLDDIWEEIELAKLGIPKEGKCVTVLTSRNKHYPNQMGAKVYPMETLSMDESLSLFEYSVGKRADDLLPIAEEVVGECKGWPIAIVTIGKSLKDKSKQVWKSALHQLKLSTPIYIEDTIKGVYNPLSQSYELLENDDDKCLFLLCSLFPEGYAISLEDLILYSMGLEEFKESPKKKKKEMFKGVQTLEDARCRVCDGVDRLKGCFLLLDVDGSTGNKVKMHDVIHDVAIVIASKKGLTDGEKAKWRSVFHSQGYESFDRFMESNFQSLSLLIIQGEWCWSSRISEGMQELNVLSLTDITFEESPQLVKSGKKLQTLELNGCGLNDLSPVVGLSNLVILKCYGCRGIEELPVEIGRLRFLKLLDLSNCGNLRRIPRGVISKLVGLEELKMLNSFKAWESRRVAEGNRKNVGITELESLRKLNCLEIHIEDVHLVEEKMLNFPKLLKKYKLFVGKIEGYYVQKELVLSDIFGRDAERNYDENVVVLSGLPVDISFGNWICGMVNTTQMLYLKGDGSRNLDLSQAHSTIKELKIEYCRMLKELVDTSTDRRELGVFPMLEHLTLVDLPDFIRLCGGRIREGSVSFNKLRTLDLQKLPALTQLWKITPNDHALLQLQTLEIEKCEAMEHVFISDQNDEHEKITFQKLKELKLGMLTSLTAFWKGTESIEFPSLEKLSIRNNEQLKRLVVPSVHNCASLLCADKVKFNGLKSLILGNYTMSNIWCGQITLFPFTTLGELTIWNFHDRSLFSLSIAEKLVRLNFLRISNCENMETLLRKEKNEEDDGKISHITFPNLRRLVMSDLLNLKSLGKGIESIEFSALENLEIINCPKFMMGIINDSSTESNEREEDGRSKHDCDCKELILHLFCPKLKRRVDSPMDRNNKEEDGDGQCNHEDGLQPFFCHKKVKFGGLQYLTLGDCYVSNIWCHQIPQRLFTTLECLAISNFHDVRSLFSLSIAENLDRLYFLSISSCENMENLLRKEKNEEDEGKISHITFPKLRILWMWNLLNLKSLGEGIESIEFATLDSLIIRKCPKLMMGISYDCTTENNEREGDNHNKEEEGDEDEDELQPLFSHKIKLGHGLRDVRIEVCDNIRSLFSSSMIKNLASLTNLEITNCKHMEKVIACEEETLDEKSIRFPKLNKLQLTELPSLGMFCEGRCTLEMPSLREIKFIDCPRLKFLNLGSITTPALYTMKLDQKIFDKEQLADIEDLNSFLGKHLTSATEAGSSKATTTKLDEESSEDGITEISEDIETDEDIMKLTRKTKPRIDEEGDEIEEEVIN